MNSSTLDTARPKIPYDEKFSIVCIANFIALIIGVFSHIYLHSKSIPYFVADSNKHLFICLICFIVIVFVSLLFSAFSTFSRSFRRFFGLEKELSQNAYSTIFQICIGLNLIFLGYAISISGGGSISPFSPYLLTAIIIGYLIAEKKRTLIYILIATLVIYFLTYFVLSIKMDNTDKDPFKLVHYVNMIVCALISFYANYRIKNNGNITR